MYLCSKQDPEVLTKTMGNINMLLEDESVAVVKRVILSMGQIYNVALRVSYKFTLLNIHFSLNNDFIKKIKSL